MLSDLRVENVREAKEKKARILEREGRRNKKEKKEYGKGSLVKSSTRASGQWAKEAPYTQNEENRS